jgi:hypothetical protein
VFLLVQELCRSDLTTVPVSSDATIWMHKARTRTLIRPPQCAVVSHYRSPKSIV